MNSKNITKKFKITVLTPVHIGSGFRKMKGIDFYFDERTAQVILVDLDEIGVALADKPQALNELANLDEHHSIGDLIRDHHLELKNSRKYAIASGPIGKDFLEFIRTGMGAPFIPGSSLKGSLRTMILSIILNGKSPDERRKLLYSIPTGGNHKYADKELLKKIFGINPNYDLMRTLTVSDSQFQDADLMLIESRVLSQDYRGWHWKPNNDNPMKVWCEVLRPGCQAEITFSLDNFLLNDPKAVNELNFPNRIAADFDRLMTDVNQYSLRMLEAELNYFEKRHNEKSELDYVLKALDTVKRHITASPKSMVIRLGWGSGWQSMTGDYINDASLMQQIRQGFRLGRPGMPFPKSRKIGFENGKPTFPFGWIKLKALP